MQKPENPIEGMITYIKEWLRANEANQRAIKPLKDILETLEWARQTIEEMPESLKDTPQMTSTISQYENAYESLLDYLPKA